MKARFNLLFVCFAILVLSTAVASDYIGNLTSKISNIVCAFYGAFKDIATGVAALIMVLSGIRWVASENDPGARKAAKDSMIHALVGLILITFINDLIPLAVGQGRTNALCGNVT